MKREWTNAQAKVQGEGRCRVCPETRVEAAHIVGRVYDTKDELGKRTVHQGDVIPLCTRHHRLYDARQLDILSVLTYEEQARAVAHLGIARAVARLTSGKVILVGRGTE